MTARGTALNYLRSYQQASLIPNLMSLETYLDQQYPGFLDIWGAAIGRIPLPNAQKELVKLAKSRGASYPTRAELNQVLFDAVPSASIFTASKAAGAEVVEDVTAGVGSFFKFGLPVIIVGFFAWHAFQAGLFKKGALKVGK